MSSLLNSSRAPLALAAALLAAALLDACGGRPRDPTLTVAAASNLVGAMDEIAAAFEKTAGVQVRLVYGSTAQLSQQIANGAPFDVFAAADTEHPEQLAARGFLAKDSRAIYAQGQLALWIPGGERIGARELADLRKPAVRFIAIAQPALAPYGEAAVEALQSSGVWPETRSKIVYANNINMAKQYAATGNAEAAFTAFSLVIGEPGTVVKIDPRLYRPLQQALGVVAASPRQAHARQFTAFLLGPNGKRILRAHGYRVGVAEEEGFEPPDESPRQRFSRPPL